MTAPRKEFKLYSTFTSSMLTWGIPAVMLAAAPFILIGTWESVEKSSDRFATISFVTIWCAGVAVAFLWAIRIPRRIELHDDGQVIFDAPLRHLEVQVTEISSIKPGGNNIGFLVVSHSRGKLHLLNQFDGFHEFLTRLKAQNPTIELRGC